MARFAAVLLTLSTVLLPVAPVFASEALQEETQPAPAPSEETEAMSLEVPEEVPKQTETPDEEVPEAKTEAPTQAETEETEPLIEDAPGIEGSSETEPEETNQPDAKEDSEESVESTIIKSNPTDETATGSEDHLALYEEIASTSASTTQNIDDVEASTASTSATSPAEEGNVSATTSDTASKEEVVSETDESKPPLIPETTEAPLMEEIEEKTEPSSLRALHWNDTNRYHFSKDECVSMGGGTFYCSEEEVTSSAPRSNRVFAALDEQGDREIYMEIEGELMQLTDNETDDDAPQYDPLSDTIVWHRLIDGRYQIIEYRRTDGSERQLTFERYNNMQPSREGAVTLWQGWVGSDWEIMLDRGGAFEMLTDNAFHDIDPHISGDYVIWQAFEEGSWRVKMHDLQTSETKTIGDAEGGSAQNPRLVLVYDTKLENGDIETRGYDLESGTDVPLSAKPAPVPKELPDPDPTEEERAMVQQVVQIKTKAESEGDEAPPGTGHEPTEDGDIYVPSNQEAGTGGDQFVLDLSPTSREAAPDIPDLIIPTFGSTKGSSDPQ